MPTTPATETRPGPREVRFVFLGSGTSAGVPVIGCDCRVCTSGDPRDRRTRPSVCFRFRDGAGQERVVLIDASPDLRQQALREGLRRCDAVLFTHDHVDHVFGLDEVRIFNVWMDSSVNIFAEAATLESLRRIYRHIFEPHRNPQRSFVAALVPHEIHAGVPLDLHGLRFTPLRLLHGRLPVLGFRIEAVESDGQLLDAQPGPLPLAYCTDVSIIPEATWSHLEGLETLVLDMLRRRKHPTHFSVDEAVATARRIGARSTWFIHMTHEILHAELSTDLPAGMALAHDGLVLA